MASPQSPADALIELAAVTRAHGLGGDVQLKLFNPESDLLLELEHVWVRDRQGQVTRCAIEHAARHGKTMIVKLAEANGRNDAEALRGSVLCVERDILPPPEPGEYYFVDLIGLETVDREGQAVGPVLEVLEYPSVECLVVERDGVRWEIPMLERYLVEIDLPQRKIVLDNLEELRDLQPKPRQRG